MQDDKNKIEVILFTTGRFVSIDELSRMAGIGSVGHIKDLIRELKKDYEKRDCALEVIEQGEKWKLNIKKEYLYLTESLLSSAELDRPTQETLAVIAYKNPVLQSEIVKIRGNTAYDHIKMLKELDFITSEPSGRTMLIKLTGKFYDYFDVVEDQLKSKMKTVENKENDTKENQA